MPAGASPEKITLFGVPIDNLTLEETLQRIEQLIRAGPTHQHVAVNVDKIVKLQRDPQLRQAVLGCDLITADGQPLVWASRLLGRPLKERVTGIDLFEKLLARCAQRRYRVFLLGARPQVVEKLVALLRERYPQLPLAGWRDGYWSQPQERDVVEQIRRARPDVLFVAISSPKKELFLSRCKAELQVPFVMGVGGSFDVMAGLVRRAPRWMQRCGLEWLYRLLQEPARLWRRYLVEDVAFLKLFWQEWRRRR
jgi:N-acetylglucosaminyldiphosphoundecaprenol N-acetyl-beta-D-mannosaminyltransferase